MFSHGWTGVVGLRGGTQKTVHYNHTISSVHTLQIPVDVDLDHLAKAVFVSFPYYKLLSFPPFYTLWKEVTKHSLQLRIEEVCSPSFRVGYLHKLSLFSHLFIYSTVYF